MVRDRNGLQMYCVDYTAVGYIINVIINEPSYEHHFGITFFTLYAFIKAYYVNCVKFKKCCQFVLIKAFIQHLVLAFIVNLLIKLSLPVSSQNIRCEILVET